MSYLGNLMKSVSRISFSFSAIILLLLVFSAAASAQSSVELLVPKKPFLDTGAGNSLEAEPTLFKERKTKRGVVLSTLSEETNIHSHYRGKGAAKFKNYIYTGRMKTADADGGIGVTFYSDYPNSDTYYRLRAYSGNPSFHIAPHNTQITEGEEDSEVLLEANRWFKFKIQVRTQENITRIFAKVWPQGTKEPKEWQIDCVDQSESRLTKGRPGVWSMGSGEKRWDKLKVVLPR